MNSIFKKFLWYLLISFIFALSALVLSIAWDKIDTYRKFEAHRLKEEAGDVTDIKKRIVLLSEAIALDPNDKRKMELARLYYQSGNKNQSIQILKNMDCGQEILVCDYLSQIGEYETVEKQLDKLSTTIKDELILANEFSHGDYDAAKTLSTKPATNVASLIIFLNKNDYASLTSLNLFNTKIYSLVNANLNQNSLVLSLAQEFNQQNQPYWALFLLENANLSSKQVDLVKIQSYLLIENYIKAYQTTLSAIENDPADKSLYEEAFVIAEKLENAEKLDLLKDNYNKLLRLSE